MWGLRRRRRLNHGLLARGGRSPCVSASLTYGQSWSPAANQGMVLPVAGHDVARPTYEHDQLVTAVQTWLNASLHTETGV